MAFTGNAGVRVVDADGDTHAFNDITDAHRWLAEEEYLPFEELRDEGGLDADARADPEWHNRLKTLFD